MVTEEACDKLWASPKIDRESSAYAYSGRRPEWRTKVSEPIVAPADSTRATESNTGALHPVAMLMAMTGPSTSKAANVAKNSTPVTQSRPATTSVPDLPPAYEDGYTLYPWRLRSKNVYKRRLWYGDRKIRWDYGVSDDNGRKPDTFFVCKMQAMTMTFHWRMNSICLEIVKSLESHRKEDDRNCHCDLEYIKTGKTCRDTSMLCLWVQGKTAKWVWDAMKEHDKEYRCGAFDFSNSRAR
ncbi:unnamed protein product [Aureobasidium mustum]|uniref:Uncharacterized protein n=1 Tax=Aureobasidium mustum TaxID=2773714 RepID=A0A9N8PM88_9PEZI|nr:unnamed protein product [Aureobasidium mustum]